MKTHAVATELDVNTITTQLFAANLITQPVIGSRDEPFRLHWGPDRAMECIVTDGEHYKLDTAKVAGVVEYDVAKDPTFALIVQYDDETLEWRIIFSYFYYHNRLRTTALKIYLKSHNIRMDILELERVLATIPDSNE